MGSPSPNQICDDEQPTRDKKREKWFRKHVSEHIDQSICAHGIMISIHICLYASKIYICNQCGSDRINRIIINHIECAENLFFISCLSMNMSDQPTTDGGGDGMWSIFCWDCGYSMILLNGFMWMDLPSTNELFTYKNQGWATEQLEIHEWSTETRNVRSVIRNVISGPPMRFAFQKKNVLRKSYSRRFLLLSLQNRLLQLWCLSRK